MKKILVLCTGNSCRSQIAEGYLRHFARNRAVVYSAGIEAHGVNSKAIAVMKEDGIDLSNHTSNNVAEYSDTDFDFVITVAITQKKIVRSFQPGQKNSTTISPILPKQTAMKRKFSKHSEM